MKKLYQILVILTILTMILTACGSGQTHVDLPPSDPNYVAGENTSVDNAPTLTDQYNKCVSESQTQDPTLMNTSGFEDIQIWWCGPEITGADLMIAPAASVAKITPVKHDDVLVVGLVVIKNTTYVLLAVIAGVTVGEAIPLQSHSNRDHNPNINDTLARKLITALLGYLAGGMLTGGPGPDHKCGVVKDAAGNVIRAFIWVADATYVEGGYVAWYYVNSNRGPWGGAYPKSTADFDASMSRRDHPEWTSEPRSCNDGNFPGPPSFLQAGQ